MRKKCLNKAVNEQDCPCPETGCPRHGICCECIRYHKGSESMPACFR